MVYMGSKSRIAKEILPIILKDRKDEQWYVEPFVGGANIIDKVDGNRIGADAFEPTIKALITIRDHTDKIPKDNKEFTEEDYNRLKELSKTTVRHDSSFVGFAYSFGGKWYGGWKRGHEADGTPQDLVAIAYRSALKQSPKLQGVQLVHSCYQDLRIPPNSIIYCDPPYKDTTKYSGKGFNHDEFYNWCREKKKEGHIIFISEYQMPDDFKCVWEKAITCNLNSKSKTLNKVEKLFTL